MKELLTLQGGYPREMDYLLNLQAELYTMSNGLFSGLGVDLVLSGCAVHDNGNGTVNIAAGLVYVAGEALRFDGANNIAADGSKAFAKDAYITSDQKTFGDGSLKNVYREAKAIIVNAAGTIAEIKVKTSLYNLKEYILDSMQAYEVKGTIKEIYDIDGDFLTNFDVSGLGVTLRWNGWHLFNANAGLVDIDGLPVNPEGRTLITVGTFTDPITGEEYVYKNGDVGGHPTVSLTGTQNGPHTHGTEVSFDNGLTGPTTHPITPNNDIGRGLRQLTINSSGLGTPHENMVPYLALYRAIKIV